MSPPVVCYRTRAIATATDVSKDTEYNIPDDQPVEVKLVVECTGEDDGTDAQPLWFFTWTTGPEGNGRRVVMLNSGFTDYNVAVYGWRNRQPLIPIATYRQNDILCESPGTEGMRTMEHSLGMFYGGHRQSLEVLAQSTVLAIMRGSITSYRAWAMQVLDYCVAGKVLEREKAAAAVRAGEAQNWKGEYTARMIDDSF